MNSTLYDLIGTVSMPAMARVRQKFDSQEITDPEAAVRRELSRPEIRSTIRPGMTIAITAGSRGIAGHKQILKTIVDMVKEAGAHPFVVPAMGSHGGAGRLWHYPRVSGLPCKVLHGHGPGRGKPGRPSGPY